MRRRPSWNGSTASAALACAALAACAAPPPPAPTPAPAPAPAPAPRPAPTPAPAPPPFAGNWSEAPQTPGDWSWRRVDGESIAEFAPPQGNPLFQVACTVQGVFLSRVGGSGEMTVHTETMAQTRPGSLSGMFLRVLFGPRDPLLDAIAFSKGRFAVEVPGQPALYLPSYPEITRVIEDCR